MSMPLRDMTQDELVAEAEIWLKVFQIPNGPDGPDQAQRADALRNYDMARTWYYRRKLESTK